MILVADSCQQFCSQLSAVLLSVVSRSALSCQQFCSQLSATYVLRCLEGGSSFLTTKKEKRNRRPTPSPSLQREGKKHHRTITWWLSALCPQKRICLEGNTSEMPGTYTSKASGCARIVDIDEWCAWKALPFKAMEVLPARPLLSDRLRPGTGLAAPINYKGKIKRKFPKWAFRWLKISILQIFAIKSFYLLCFNRFLFYLCKRDIIIKFNMRRFCFDTFSHQALSELHRYRAVMFSPTEA